MTSVLPHILVWLNAAANAMPNGSHRNADATREDKSRLIAASQKTKKRIVKV